MMTESEPVPKGSPTAIRLVRARARARVRARLRVRVRVRVRARARARARARVRARSRVRVRVRAPPCRTSSLFRAASFFSLSLCLPMSTWQVS